MAIEKRKRGRPLEDPEHGPLSGKERKRRWRDQRRRREFRSAPLLYEGSGGLTFHLGQQGESEERTQRERELDRVKGPYVSQPDGDIEDAWRAHSLDREPAAARQADQQQYPGRWTVKHRSQRWWVPDRSDQGRLSTKDQVFAPGEVTEVWEAYRLDLLHRQRWLRNEDAYLQRVYMELEKGPRPVSGFPTWLKPLVKRGLARLLEIGVLDEELKPNVWYRGKGRPSHYLVRVYSLKSGAVARDSAAADEDTWI